jgi:GNAT superfamily N-acetyltransferase
MTSQDGLSVRRGAIEDAAALTALAIRSKAHWGYPDSLMQLFRAELVISEGYLSAATVLVAEVIDRVVGFAGFSLSGTAPELQYLFVEPEFIGNGCGKILWQKAVEEARAMGWSSFSIVADPNAESFYVKQGAIRTGETKTSASPERKLPVLVYRL